MGHLVAHFMSLSPYNLLLQHHAHLQRACPTNRCNILSLSVFADPVVSELDKSFHALFVTFVLCACLYAVPRAVNHTNAVHGSNWTKANADNKIKLMKQNAKAVRDFNTQVTGGGPKYLGMTVQQRKAKANMLAFKSLPTALTKKMYDLGMKLCNEDLPMPNGAPGAAAAGTDDGEGEYSLRETLQARQFCHKELFWC